MPAILKLPIVSHPWASFAPCFQSHTSVCSFQQVPEYAPSLRPLRLRNFMEQSLSHKYNNNSFNYDHYLKNINTLFFPGDKVFLFLLVFLIA